jgi:integrase
MSVRKRTWKNKDDEQSAWVCNYVDGTGKGHLKTFSTRKEAVDWEARTKIEVKEGRHRPDSESITVREAGELWIKNGIANGLERTTLDQYRWLLDRQIVPYLGNVKLSRLSTPTVNEFRNKLLEGIPAPGETVGAKRSLYMVKRVVSALSSIVADAQQAGHVSQNVVRGLASRKKKKGKATQRRKLKVGVDIPTPAEVRAIVANLKPDGRRRPLILTALFTGLRGSELRGLRWQDVDLDRRELNVHQRADFYNDIGAPKSEAGERTVPLPPMVVAALREWKVACPNGPLGLVFPNSRGKVEGHGHIVERDWWRAQGRRGCLHRRQGRRRQGDRRARAQTPLHRPALHPALLRLVVHQPAPGRRDGRERAAGEGGAGAPGARDHQHDDGHLRPPVPAGRRPGRAGGRRAVLRHRDRASTKPRQSCAFSVDNVIISTLRDYHFCLYPGEDRGKLKESASNTPRAMARATT